VSIHTPALAAVFEEHLQAMARVHELSVQRRIAIEREAAMEAKVAKIYAGVKALAGSFLGPRSPRMREFGIEPDRKPQMTPATKLLANLKRQETRRRRGLVSKKRRGKT
jgi:hypothetical protein